MITVTSKGSFHNVEKFLTKSRDAEIRNALAKYGERGVNALSNATPTRSGRTAGSWYYEIESSKGSHSIIWRNSNVNDGQPIAILLQYGHGTGTGGYVQGRDYINPAIQPIFDQIAEDIWKEVTS